MDNPSQSFEALLRIIHQVEWSLPGPQLNIEAIYVGEDETYLAYPPPRDEPFTASGLRDPALGNTGPLEFSEIYGLKVSPTPRYAVHCSKYQAKYAALSELAASIPGVRVDDSGLSLKRAAA